MKGKTLRNTILLFMGLHLFVSCRLMPFSKNVNVKMTPSSSDYISISGNELTSGFPYHHTWWIAYSDRAKNNSQVGMEDNMPVKQLEFATPVIIIKEKGVFVKIAAYNPEVNLVSLKGKIERKSIKVLGWIRKDKLLLWSSALVEKTTGIVAKNIVGFSNAEALLHADRYIDHDSLILFERPDLKDRNGRLLAIGSIVYLFKKSGDGKSYLIGSSQKLIPEAASISLLGWVSADVLSFWGTKSMFSFLGNSKDTNKNTSMASSTTLFYRNELDATAKDLALVIHVEESQEQPLFQNLFPIRKMVTHDDSMLNTGFIANVLDYSGDKVYNVLGEPVYCKRYREILKKSKHVNVVFVLDISHNNSAYFPYITTAIQDLQYYFDTTTLFRQYRFGVVTYKQSPCPGDIMDPVLPLTSSYDNVIDFWEQKQKYNHCVASSTWQPLYNGLYNAGNLLKPYPDETNIILLIGTSGNTNAPLDPSLNRVISVLSQARAKLMLFQSISKTNDAYNDFVLSAERIVSNSGENIGELKKEKLVDPNDVLSNTSYSLIGEDSGVYSLDYPSGSMTQGFVLFPHKGEIMPPGMVKKYFEILMAQIIIDHKKTNDALTSYFKKIGFRNTKLNQDYLPFFDTDSVPVSEKLAQVISGGQNGSFLPAYFPWQPFGIADTSTPITYSVFLNPDELEQQVYLFEDIYNKTAAFEHFKPGRAYRRYHRFLKHYIKTKNIPASTNIKEMTLAESLYLFSGYISQDSVLNHLQIHALKKKKNRTLGLTYFKSLKISADKQMLARQNTRNKLDINGVSFFLIDKNEMP